MIKAILGKRLQMKVEQEAWPRRRTDELTLADLRASSMQQTACHASAEGVAKLANVVIWGEPCRGRKSCRWAPSRTFFRFSNILERSTLRSRTSGNFFIGSRVTERPPTAVAHFDQGAPD
jgi:hypothetical protein